jgi:hypothetical protein
MLDPRLGQTALHFAAWAGRVEVVKRLLTAGMMVIMMIMIMMRGVKDDDDDEWSYG